MCGAKGNSNQIKVGSENNKNNRPRFKCKVKPQE